MPFCRICEEYMFDHRPHVCPPEWELLQEDELKSLGRGPASGRFYPPEWVLVYGTDEEHACEKWAERYDQNGDYTIVSGRHGAEIVYIRKVADEDFIGPTPAQRWSVSGESVPQYSAEREEVKHERA